MVWLRSPHTASLPSNSSQPTIYGPMTPASTRIGPSPSFNKPASGLVMFNDVHPWTLPLLAPIAYPDFT
ncbi:hypothetical protein C8R43DRAFT_1125030 [Mycena crocata]|nr:hypothetical protein C8R43DRAFT_1125030 [Mycena crocata]